MLITVMMLVDVTDDYHRGLSLEHVMSELFIMMLAIFGLLLYLRNMIDQVQQHMHVMNVDLQKAEADARHWRAQSSSLLQGLALQIQKQFTQWGLSKAEADIGLLILKGFSHHEIAELRGASERTVREQARALYRKAGLNSKAELSAFFLEDLLLPDADLKVPA
ncbi:MAG TPA: LuxR C-terminal-related transcriptional regulator [Methylophilus sp.]